RIWRKLSRRWAFVMTMVLAFCTCAPSAPAAPDHELDQIAGTLLFALFPPLREALYEVFHRNKNAFELGCALEALSEMACDDRSVQVFESVDKALLQSGRATRLLWDEFVKYRNGLPRADGQWSVVAICVTSREDNAGIDARQQPLSVMKFG